MSAALLTGGASSIQVTVRVRPFTIREAAQITKIDDGPTFFGDGNLAGTPKPSLTNKGIRRVIKVVDDQFLIFDPPEENPIARFGQKIIGPRGKQQKDMKFGFDRVFDENATQGEVYEQTTKNLLDSVLEGYNATVFAYGATGCGKTHTISGTKQQPGIIFLTLAELFQRIEDLRNEKSIELSLSYLEIYNETIRDLLVPVALQKPLNLREDSNSSIAVAGLSTHRPCSVHEVMDMIMMGNENRTMSPTEANATSSRSHAVLQVNVVQKNKTAGLSEDVFSATLSIIDLAGSERASVTKNRGDRLLEGANINRSLLALGNCINALCDQTKKNHVPYRDSKLTRLLKFSLGGNCKTVMIVCVSPSSHHYDETHNTLKYADRAKKIKTKVSRNMINVNRHVSQYVKAIYDLQQEVADLKKRLGDSVKEAMDKIKKQNVSRDGAMKEGIRRIRAAYDGSADQRKQSANHRGGIREADRRIANLNAWLMAFDSYFSAGFHPSESLSTIRGQAEHAILDIQRRKMVLEQTLQNDPWYRSIETALKSSLDSLTRLDGGAREEDIEILDREANLRRMMGENEIMERLYEDSLDTNSIVQLTKAHFETITQLEHIREMEPEQALTEAPMALFNLVQSCTVATGQVVTPNGQIALPEYVAATPGKKRISNAAFGFSPAKRPNFNTSVPAAMDDSFIPRSPAAGRGTPRRKVHTPSKKNVQFMKKRVRWREDVVDVEQQSDSLAKRVLRQDVQRRSQQQGGLPSVPDVDESILDAGDGMTFVGPAVGSSSTGGISKAKRAGSAGNSHGGAITSAAPLMDVHVDSDSELMPPPAPPIRPSSLATAPLGAATTSSSSSVSASTGASAPPVRSNRMAIGFLSSKDAGEGDTNSNQSSPDVGRNTGSKRSHIPGSGNSTYSPLRETDPNNAANRSAGTTSRVGYSSNTTYSATGVPTTAAAGSASPLAKSAPGAFSESNTDSYSSSDEQPASVRPPRFQPSRLTGGLQIKPAHKRYSVATAGGAGGAGGHRPSITASFAAPTASVRARRKSPIRGQVGGSPDASFTTAGGNHTIHNPKSGSGAPRRSVMPGAIKALSPRSSGVGVQRSASGSHPSRRLTVSGAFTGEQLLGALQKENMIHPGDVSVSGLAAVPTVSTTAAAATAATANATGNAGGLNAPPMRMR